MVYLVLNINNENKDQQNFYTEYKIKLYLV